MDIFVVGLVSVLYCVRTAHSKQCCHKNKELCFHLTELCIPVIVIASDPLLKVAQAKCQVARPAQVNNEMAPALARRPCMVIVIIIRRLHLQDMHFVSPIKNLLLTTDLAPASQAVVAKTARSGYFAKHKGS